MNDDIRDGATYQTGSVPRTTQCQECHRRWRHAFTSRRLEENPMAWRGGGWLETGSERTPAPAGYPISKRFSSKEKMGPGRICTSRS